MQKRMNDLCTDSSFLNHLKLIGSSEARAVTAKWPFVGKIKVIAPYGTRKLIIGIQPVFIIGSAEALPILCVSDFCE